MQHTMRAKGQRLVRDPDGTPIRAADVTLGSAFHVIPEDLASLSHHDGYLEEKAKAIVLMMRLRPEQLIESEERQDWSYDGIVAYSKVSPTSAALWPSTNSRRTTCCAPAISRSSTSPTTPRSSSARLRARCRSCRSWSTTRDTCVARSDFTEPVGQSFWERS